MSKLKIYTIRIDTSFYKEVKVCAETEEQAREQAKNTPITAMTEYGTATKIIDVEKAVEIMDCSNCHSKNLVAKINFMYNVKKEDFLKIAQLLAKRDEDECWEHNIDPNNIERFNGCVNEYLMRVADDKDLETILGFLRY